MAAILAAKDNPTTRPVDPAKLARRPRALKTPIGSVTVPDSSEPADEPSRPPDDEAATAKEPTVHTEIQWRLLKLGNDMGLDVWPARNDRSREWNGHRFSDLPRLRADLPRQFDEVTLGDPWGMPHLCPSPVLVPTGPKPQASWSAARSGLRPPRVMVLAVPSDADAVRRSRPLRVR